MKKILFLTCLTLCFSVFKQTDVYAQSGPRPRGGAGRPVMGPPQDTMNHGNPDDLVLEHFPSIPDLGLEQRADIGIILKNEQEKIDQKVKQQRDKSNKKIKKILSEEQYKVFMEKRDEFQFRKEPSRQFNRPPNGQRRGDRPEGRHP